MSQARKEQPSIAPEQALIQRIQREYEAKTIVLPSLPEIVTKIRGAIQHSSVDVNAIAKIIQLDTNIAVRFIQIANSPLNRSSGTINNCQSAIMRLGLTVTRNIVTCLVLNNVFNAKSRTLRTRIRQLWQHSRHVAAISHVLARFVVGLDGDKAMLAGLVHDVGVLPILHYANEFPELLEQPERLDSIIARLRGELGRQILTSWKFDEDLVVVPEAAEDWRRDADTHPDYVDIVIVAQAHSSFGKHHAKELPSVKEMPAFKKLNLDQKGAEGSLELLNDAKDEIEAAMQLLSM